MPEQTQDVLLAVASMAYGGLHILLRLLSLHLCNEYQSLPKNKTRKGCKRALSNHLKKPRCKPLLVEDLSGGSAGDAA